MSSSLKMPTIRTLVLLGGLLFVTAATAATAPAQAPEALWYSVDTEASVRSFLANAHRISAVAPQSFRMDSMGVITGRVDPRVVARAREAKVKLIPLVMNPGFDQPAFHRVLVHPDARRTAVRGITALCRDNGFDGIQFDFENIDVADRDAFTAFSREVADSLHAIGCTISAAVVPRTSESPGPTSYHAWMFENWRGAYDYKALADCMDFLSFMTYSQHTRRTPPGPIAGYPWMEAALRHVRSLGVPANKISLGLPSYSHRWFATWDAAGGGRVSGHGLAWAEAVLLLADNQATSTWDERQKESVAIWENAGLNEYLYLQDARAFDARLALVRTYGLRGYSVWVLGQEDPAIWSLPGLR